MACKDVVVLGPADTDDLVWPRYNMEKKNVVICFEPDFRALREYFGDMFELRYLLLIGDENDHKTWATYAQARKCGYRMVVGLFSRSMMTLKIWRWTGVLLVSQFFAGIKLLIPWVYNAGIYARLVARITYSARITSAL